MTKINARDIILQKLGAPPPSGIRDIHYLRQRKQQQLQTAIDEAVEQVVSAFNLSRMLNPRGPKTAYLAQALQILESIAGA